MQAADCIFLMGGDVKLQMALIRDLGLISELRASRAVILGVSAGSMNMGRCVAEIWESKTLYEGLGLTDITVKGHYTEDAWFLPALKEISGIRPVAAMEDESAIFIQGGTAWSLGNIHWIVKGEIRVFTGCSGYVKKNPEAGSSHKGSRRIPGDTAGCALCPVRRMWSSIRTAKASVRLPKK